MSKTIQAMYSVTILRSLWKWVCGYCGRPNTTHAQIHEHKRNARCGHCRRGAFLELSGGAEAAPRNAWTFLTRALEGDETRELTDVLARATENGSRAWFGDTRDPAKPPLSPSQLETEAAIRNARAERSDERLRRRGDQHAGHAPSKRKATGIPARPRRQAKRGPGRRFVPGTHAASRAKRASRP